MPPEGLAGHCIATLFGEVTRAFVTSALINHMIDPCINQLTEVAQMDRRIDAHIARTQFGQIMDLATKNNERFVVDRRGEPAVVIMSVEDFIKTAVPAPDWLQKAWTGAKRRGIDALTPEDIDAEIAAHRRKKTEGK
jgi:prevent-host-death family protein